MQSFCGDICTFCILGAMFVLCCGHALVTLCTMHLPLLVAIKLFFNTIFSMLFDFNFVGSSFKLHNILLSF